jgi:hypothetical protein
MYISSKQQIQNLVNKLRSTGLLIDEKQKYKRQVLTEERLDDNTSQTWNIHVKKKHGNVCLKILECQSLVQEGQHNCLSLDPMKQQ